MDQITIDLTDLAPPGGRRRPAVGPGARAPDALGEFLLARRSEPPSRSMLVFVPRIPPGLWQPYESASSQEEPTHAVE